MILYVFIVRVFLFVKHKFVGVKIYEPVTVTGDGQGIEKKKHERNGGESGVIGEWLSTPPPLSPPLPRDCRIKLMLILKPLETKLLFYALL